MAASELAAAEAVLKSIEGRWQTIYAEVDGEALPDDRFSQTIGEFSDNRFKIEKAGVVAYEGTFYINVSSNPCGIVLIYSKSVNPMFLGGPRAGIVQIFEDTKKTNFSEIGFPPPQDFNTFRNSGRALTVHRREGSTRVRELLASGTNLGCGIMW